MRSVRGPPPRLPPANAAIVPLLHPAASERETVKSPASVEFPVVAIVIY